MIEKHVKQIIQGIIIGEEVEYVSKEHATEVYKKSTEIMDFIKGLSPTDREKIFGGQNQNKYAPITKEDFPNANELR